MRTFYVVLTSGLLFGAPLATLGRRELGDVGLWLGLLPIVLATPLALPWLDPPAEHGALQVLAHVVRRIARNTTLGMPQQRDLAGLQVADGVVSVPIGHRLEVRAVYRVPTLNLDTASAETRRALERSGARSSTDFRTRSRS